MSDTHVRSNQQVGRDGLPAISVVTPVYNCADLLEECIASVLEQGYPNLEYGIVDGGSTDGTVDVIRKYEDRLAFWISEPDDGQADALNKAFRRATGDLVCWLNADDFYYPGALAAGAEAYRAHPDAPFYFGNGYRVDRTGRRLEQFFPDGNVRFNRDAFVYGLNHVLQPSTFIRRVALEEVGLLDTGLHYGFDSDIWLKLSELGRPRPIHEHIAASREHATTKTATGSFERAEELRRLAERHAGVAATPGSIAYYLHTLHGLASRRPDVFPREYVKAIEEFWGQTSALFGRYGARPDGFPVHELSARLHTPRARDRQRARMRVGIVLRQVTRELSGGIVNVLVGTLHELFRLRPEVEFIVYCTVFNHDLLAVEAPNVETIALPLDTFFADLRQLCSAHDIDVLFRAYPTVERVDFPVLRQIFLLPDLQHEYYPNFFDSRTLLARKLAFSVALEGAAAIMTISEFARRTIEERTGPDRDVFVAHPSLLPEFVAARSDDATDDERATLPAGDFFFFPANLWPHKNHARLFDAFRSFRERTASSAELVLTGSPLGWKELRARYADLPIRHLGYVSPSHLKLLYERSLALAFFSVYEGFGIPVLEAFEAGTPVVCSNTTSLPEVAGDAALMCDPENVDEISRLLEQIATDEELRARLVARGRLRLRDFGWADAAAQLGAAIDRVRNRAESPALGDLPLVSIVTPSYNQGRFIRRTIESVLAQTYPNIEYFVVDGGSTDETLDVLRSFGDRVRWVSEPDSGTAEAINKGLRAANGEIVGYLNSDDVLLPHAIEQVVEHFRNHPDCDLVYGDADYIDESDQVTGSYRTADYSFERLMEDCCICQPAAYWRSSAGEAVGAFDERVENSIDYDYWIRFDRAGFVLQHMPETIALSRLHADAKTLRARRDIYHEIFRICRDRGGYVSRNYVHGFWHHVAYERGNPGRLLRHSSAVRAAFVEVHYRFLNRPRFTRESLGAKRFAARRKLVVRLQRSPHLFAAALRARSVVNGLRPAARHGAAGRASVRGNGRLRVTGFWPDNWLADRVDVVVDAREHTRNVRIVGRPVAEMTLQVSANGTQLGRFELRESEREAVTLQLPPGPRELITFAFSDHVVDAQGRAVAFLLQETNLFKEEDLYALA